MAWLNITWPHGTSHQAGLLALGSRESCALPILEDRGARERYWSSLAARARLRATLREIATADSSSDPASSAVCAFGPGTKWATTNSNKQPTTRFALPQPRFTSGGDDPMNRGFANGVGNGRLSNACARCGALLTRKTAAKKVAT